MAEHEIPADLIDALVRACHDEGAFCGECDYESALDEDDGCRWCQRYLTGYAQAALAALAEWADGALIDPSTWTRVTAARLMCPVHGDAACPEEYMLKEDGTPWAHYAAHWDESMRCGRRPTLTREDP